jgi:PAS domain S-box-containing protein
MKYSFCRATSKFCGGGWRGPLLCRWIGVALLFLMSLDSLATPQWEFRLFPTPDGVPIAEVNDICEDYDGAIWVVTWGGGVHRIHGTEWKHFTKADGLGDDWARSVTPSRYGGVWLGTGEGLTRVRGDSMETLSPDNFPLFQEEDIRFVQELSNGQLWVSAGDGRVFVRDPEIGGTTNIRLGWKTMIEADEFSGHVIHQIVETDPNTLLVSIEKETPFWVRDGVMQRDSFQGPEGWHSIFKQERDEESVLWLADRARANLYRYEAGAWVPQPHAVSGAVEMTQSYSGQLFAVTNKGLHAQQEEGWKKFEMPSSVGSPELKVVTIDRNGAVWLGGKEGVIRGSLTSWSLSNAGEDDEPVTILPRSFLTSPHLAISFKGEVFQGDEDGWKPMVRLDPWDARPWSLDDQHWPEDPPLLADTKVRRPWFGVGENELHMVENSALSVYSLEDGSRTSHRQLAPVPPQGGHYFITSDERILCLTTLGAFEYADEAWRPFPDVPGYQRRWTRVITETEPGVLYVGLNDGIERWTESGAEYFGEAHGVNPKDVIHAVCPSPSGDVWFGSYGSGIYRYDGTTFHQMSEDEGLQNHSVRSILTASDGAIWLAYRRTGLSKYADGHWVHYSRANGLPNAAALYFAEGASRDIWMGTMEGTLYQHIPDSESPDTSIVVGPTEVDPHGIAVFSFSAWDAWNQTLVRDLLYSWRLVSLQGDGEPEAAWSPRQTETIVVTEALPRGAYRFEVRSIDENGNTDPTPDQVSFSVSPPFWMTPAFYLPLLFSLTLAIVAFIFRWISHRALLLSEAALKESNQRLHLENKERERLELAIEQCAETIVITDIDGTIQYVNPAYERTMGYAQEEVLGLNSRSLRSGEHDEAFYTEISDTLMRDQNWSGRIINRKKNGALFTEEVTISPVRNVSGESVSHVAIKRDITRESELENQLRQSQKMEAIGLLAGGVAHDFNNLLQAILGHGELALTEVAADSSVGSSIGEILTAGGRAATLVRQLLAFSRRQVLRMEDVDLNFSINDTSKMLRRVIGEHITLNVVPSHDLGIVRADPGQIGQILMNLCVNARDAMPTGGTITIETENVQLDETFSNTHSWATPGHYVLLSVTDTGCGMEKETLSEIFEPFFTTKDVGEGSGLGLSTVYGLIKQHEGMIHVYSELSTGTTFKIYLPLAKYAEKAAEEVRETPVIGGTETILLAEDETSIRNVSKLMLEKEGYTVLTACDGEEALKVYAKHSSEIDMLLLDVMMPKVGGRAVYDHVHKLRPKIPVLFASGYSMHTIDTSFVLEENLTLINKPFRRDDLLRKIRHVLDDHG